MFHRFLFRNLGKDIQKSAKSCKKSQEKRICRLAGVLKGILKGTFASHISLHFRLTSPWRLDYQKSSFWNVTKKKWNAGSVLRTRWTWKLFLRSLKVLEKTSVVELLLIKPRNYDPTIYFLKNFLNFRSKFLKLAQQLFLKTPWKHCFENILPQPQQKNLYEIMVILSTVWNHGKESLSVT